MTIDKIKEIIKNDEYDNVFIEQLKLDPRIGVQKIITSLKKEEDKKRELYKRFITLKKFDNQYKDKEDNIIVGVDEVGRGPLAGPVICCAVILKEDFDVIEVFDSKKLTKKKRDSLIEEIKEKVVDYSISFISPSEIDELNIYQASKKGMIDAINNLNYKPNIILSDAMDLNILGIKNISLIKGDMKSLSIATASILAKDIRDNLMIQYHEIYPMYDFINNFGYGTKKHLEGLKLNGECDIHRKSFEPIKSRKF